MAALVAAGIPESATVFSIVEESPLANLAARLAHKFFKPTAYALDGPYSRAAVYADTLERTGIVNTVGDSTALLGTVAGGGTFLYTYGNTQYINNDTVHIVGTTREKHIKNTIGTVKKGKVHSIEPFNVVKYKKHIVIDKNYSTKRYFATMPLRKKGTNLSQRLKRLESRVSPEVKYYEEVFAPTAVGPGSIATADFFSAVRGTANNSFNGNEIKILRAEVVGYPLGGVNSTLSGVNVECFLIKSKQAGLPLLTDFKPGASNTGSVLDRDKGVTMRHWMINLNNQCVKFKHRFRYPLRVHIDDSQTVRQNQLYFVVKNNGAAALPANSNFTLRVYYVDP